MADRIRQRGDSSTARQTYRGVRMRRWGKWVSEIRDPQKKKRIWLGSFRSATEAAHAFDAAALMCLRNPVAQLNFPHHYYALPPGSPGNYTAREIQAAGAAAAAASVGRSFSYIDFISSSTSSSSDSDEGQELEDITYTGNGYGNTAGHQSGCQSGRQSGHQSSHHSSSYVGGWTNFDEDLNLVSEMACGMLIQPPASHDEDDYDDHDYNYGTSLWN